MFLILCLFLFEGDFSPPFDGRKPRRNAIMNFLVWVFSPPFLFSRQDAVEASML